MTIKPKLNRTLGGFTLIETLVVLIITSVILFFTVSMVTNFNREKVSEELFWQSFQSKFTRAEEFSRVHHTQTLIAFKPRDQVSFSNHAFTEHDRDLSALKMPKELSTVGAYRLRISDDGHVSPKTVKWHSGAYHKDLFQKFQLGWGIYHVVS